MGNLEKDTPPPGGHVFKETKTIFELIQDTIGTNLLTKFHEDRKKMWPLEKNAPPPGGHVLQPKGIIFELVQDISKMTLGSHVFQAKEFHEDRKINVASGVLTRKNVQTPGGYVFQPTGIIFELVQVIIGMNLLTKVLTRKNAPLLGSHFHETRKINVALRVLTRKNAPPPCGNFHEDQTINVASRVKNAPPLGSHVFQANVTIFEFIQDIIETNLLTKFHEDWTINVAYRELTRHMLTPHN
ncbi:hypothetical protein DPMN_109339 [Dreissena polymorpha]|uniref:Uncharacterized protein n=1 Tax=Dreissena polymorpha TaxID=45954 RepID=A0A9D4KA36_DREPO|nr:hypothetical protein DPMN_109339 [Dreissena polymorpha]